MLYLRTTINNQHRYIDLFEDEVISMEYSYAEIQDITSKNSTYTKSFSLPGSKDNNDIFQHYYDLNSSMTDYDIRDVFEAEFLEDGYQLIKGYIRLENVSVQNKNVVYNVVFYSNVGLLTSNIGDKVLRDLDFTELDHPYLEQVITRSIMDPDFSGGTLPYEDGRITYMLAQYGYEYDEDNNIITNSTPIIDYRSGQVPGYFDNIGTPLRFYYLKPAIQVKWMYEKIYQEAGFNIKSDFFDTSYFKRYYLPLTFNTSSLYLNQAVSPQFQWIQDTTTGGTLTSYILQWTQISTGLQTDVERILQLPEIVNNIDAHLYSNYTFRVQQAGNYKVKISLKGFNTEPPDPFQDRTAVAELQLNQVELGGVNGTSGTTIFRRTSTARAGQGFTDTYEANVYLDPIYNYAFDVDTEIGAQPPIALTYAEFEIIDGPRTIVGDVELKLEFPENEEKQLDFLTTINRRFNLVVVPDKETPDTFVVEPIIDYLNRGETLDWSDRLDYNSNITIAPTTSLVNGTLWMNAQDDEDYGNVEFKKTSNIIYGTSYKKLNLDYQNTTTQFNGQVSHPVDDTLLNINTPNITIPIYYITREDNNEGEVLLYYNARKTKPRIVFRGLNIPANNVGKYSNPTGTTGNNSFYIEKERIDIFPSYNRFGTYPWGLTGFTHAVNFNKDHRFNPSEFDFRCYEDLYDVYYEDYINDITSSDNRILVGSFYLHSEEIAGLKGNERIYLNGNYYRINKINGFDLTKRSLTEVELVKITGDYTPHPVRYYQLQNCTNPTDILYTNTDLNYTIWAYLGKQVKVGTQCYRITNVPYNPNVTYQQLEVPFQTDSFIPQFYNDCLCSVPTTELAIYRELNCDFPQVTPTQPNPEQYYYYVLDNCQIQEQPVSTLARSLTYYNLGDVVRTSNGGSFCYFVQAYTTIVNTNDITTTYIDCPTCIADVPTPTPTRTPTLTPTPSTTPCNCVEFEAQNEYPTSGNLTYRDCYGVTQNVIIPAFQNFISCGCAGSFIPGIGINITTGFSCIEPTPSVSLTPTTTPGLSPTSSPTPTPTPQVCFEYYVENENPYSVVFSYRDCCTNALITEGLGSFQNVTLCSRTTPTGDVVVAFLGACPSPPLCSPTPTPTISVTPSPSKTPIPPPPSNTPGVTSAFG